MSEGEPGRPERATMDDVAKLAGVSKSTVSRIIGRNVGAIQISPKTVEKVWEAARSLDYQPHAAARALGRQRTDTIAVVVPSGSPGHHERRFSNLKISEALSGIDRATSNRGYNVILQITAGDPFDDPRHRRVWSSGAVDGILWCWEPLRDVEQLPLPVVAVNAVAATEGRGEIGVVNTDDHPGSTLALRHLAELGHTRVAHIAGPEDNWNARERRRAYLDFCTAAGWEPVVESGDGFEDTGISAIGRLLSRDDAPTAVFVGGDRMAIGVLAEARSRGVRVPDDLAVIGADGMDFIRFATPRLTTVAMMMYEAARDGANMLMDLIEDRTAEPQQRFASTQLIVLDSCGFRAKYPEHPGESVARNPEELDLLHKRAAEAHAHG